MIGGFGGHRAGERHRWIMKTLNAPSSSAFVIRCWFPCQFFSNLIVHSYMFPLSGFNSEIRGTSGQSEYLETIVVVHLRIYLRKNRRNGLQVTCFCFDLWLILQLCWINSINVQSASFIGGYFALPLWSLLIRCSRSSTAKVWTGTPWSFVIPQRLCP